jgi:hypothetical protein
MDCQGIGDSQRISGRGEVGRAENGARITSGKFA